MKKNIVLLYMHTFLATFILFYISDTLFFIERGLSSSQYISFVGVSFLVKLLFEIPFGILADKHNKKLLLLTSNILFILAIIILINSYNYFDFLVGIIIIAINNSLSSGIVNSVLYESIEDKEKFKKSLFYNSFFYNTSYMLAMIVGGYIGQTFGLVYTYYFSFIPFIIDFLIILMIKTDVTDKTIDAGNNISILKNGIKEVFYNKKLSKMILTSAVLFSGIRLVEESHPAYSSNIGVSVFIIGIYTSLILLFCIIGSYIGSKIKKNMYDFVLNINPIISGVCILIVGLLNNFIGIIFILIIYIFSDSFENIMMSQLHKSISSKSRVTVESINQFILGIVGVIFSILMTILLKFMKINEMYILIGCIIILFGIISIIISKNKLNKQNILVK